MGQQPPRRSGSQQLPLSAVENATHFVDVLLRGMGRRLRAAARGDEDLHSLQTQRSLPGGAKQVIPAGQMVSMLLVEEGWEIHRANFSKEGSSTPLKLGQVERPFTIVLFLLQSCRSILCGAVLKEGGLTPTFCKRQRAAHPDPWGCHCIASVCKLRGVMMRKRTALGPGCS